VPGQSLGTSQLLGGALELAHGGSVSSIDLPDQFSWEMGAEVEPTLLRIVWIISLCKSWIPVYKSLACFDVCSSFDLFQVVSLVMVDL
jgi:hypothetical protein